MMVKVKRKRNFPLHKLIPNIVTLGALCSGLSSIRFAMIERWEIAVTFIVLAAFLDGIDGSVARLLKATSNFGAQLDSLSDFLCFGVAPALVLYMWALQDIKRFGWGVVLLFAICSSMRLARFNTSLMEEKKEAWQDHYFTGVPAPAGALLAILPLVLTLQFGEGMFDNPWLVIGYLPFIGVLMVSRLPTFALKGKRIPTRFALPIMLLAVFLLVSFVIETWATLAALCVLYLLTLPVAYQQSRRLMHLADTASNSESSSPASQ